MMRKILFNLFRMNLLAALLAFLSLISLHLTIMVPSGNPAAALTGLHLWEFTSFGFVLMVAPCVIMLMSRMYAKVQNAHVILIGILMLALIGYNHGIIVGSEWIRSMTAGTVQYERALVVYPFLLLMSASILMVHMEFADFFDAFEKAFEEDYDLDDEYYDSYAR